MFDLKTIKFNYYPAKITDSHPLGDISLETFLGKLKYPSKHIVETFEKIKQAANNGNEKLKNELKTRLYSFTPCVYVNGSRKYENIQHFCGLMALDFDKLPSEEYANEWKKALFEEYKCVIATWLSPSRLGVRALVKIPVVHSVGEFKEHFHAIQNELKKYNGWDRAPQNCILPMFLSYDYNLLSRENPTTWTGKYREPEPPPVKQYIITDKFSQVERIMKSAIDKIISNGHPQLRSAARSLGGYVGGGYIDVATATQMIFKMIDGNAYLSQKASVYKRTANTMIKEGQKNPLFLK